MGRMLDALKNLEHDGEPPVAVTVPVVVKQPAGNLSSSSKRPEATPPLAEPEMGSPAARAAGGDAVPSPFLATLASSTSPRNEERSPVGQQLATQQPGLPQTATPQAVVQQTKPPPAVTAAAATLAKLKASVPQSRAPNPTAPTSAPLLAVVESPWETPAASLPLPSPQQSPMVPAGSGGKVLVRGATEAPRQEARLPEALLEFQLPGPRSSTTRLEDTVNFALADPRRSVPLEQLARRMRAELRADTGRCWLLADAGEHHDSADLAAHLGAIFASQLGDVLLVDGNLDCALLSAGLNVIDKPGLAQTAVVGAKAWQNLLQPTAWQHLFVLPAGQWVAGMPDPSAAWTDLLSQAERRFRLVLVDGGPAAEASCKALGRICDSTFVVIRLGLTEAREARQAMQQLRAGGARVIGSIATSVPGL